MDSGRSWPSGVGMSWPLPCLVLRNDTIQEPDPSLAEILVDLAGEKRTSAWIKQGKIGGLQPGEVGGRDQP